MIIFYMDDTGESDDIGFAALGVPVETWKEAYDALLQSRRALRSQHRIPLSAELHATKFLGGRGTAGQAVPLEQDRLSIFQNTLGLAASIQNATLICAFDKKRNEARLYERLMNRINACAASRGTHALIISDEGKDKRFRALARKLGRHNPIPSQFGSWPDGSQSRNIPNERIIEDVIFRDSSHCRFIQLVDFCAYALLRFERPHSARPELSS